VGGSADLNSGAIAVARAFPEQAWLALGFDRDQSSNASPEVLIETLRMLSSNDANETNKNNSRQFATFDDKTIRENLMICAVGETGLDFHYRPETAEGQCALFAAQLRLADEWRLPVIVHTREADEATLRVLDETPWHGEGLRGVIHCFTGDKAFAAQLLDRQFMISFSGIVTFRNADMLRESAAFVPADRILIETDSPFLTPVPMRGKPNEPAFVSHVANGIAKVRNTTAEHIAELTWRNAERLFGL